MNKNSKCKYLLLSFALAAVLSTTVFSVSYAMWSGDEDILSAAVKVGAWESGSPEKPDDPVYSGIGYYASDGAYKIIDDIEYPDDAYNPVIFVKPSYKGQKAYLSLRGVGFASLIFYDYTDSVKIEGDEIVFGEVTWYYINAVVFPDGGGMISFYNNTKPEEGDNIPAFELE